MKKSLLALAALTAFAGVASAQSSVTVFGVVDLSMRNVEYGDVSQSQLATDGNSSSRLGFRGVEDLGGGLRAAFHIEGSLVADNGNAAGQTWQRRSTVSLLGGFGEFRMGRDYTPTFWNWTVFDPFGTNGVGAATNLALEVAGLAPGGSYGTLVRANNTVGYVLPAGQYGPGFYGQLQVAAGEGTFGNKTFQGRLGFKAGPIDVAGSYGETQVSPSVDGKTWNIAGSYSMSFLVLSGFYGEIDVSNLKQKNWFIGGQVPFGVTTIKMTYGSVERSGAAGTNVGGVGCVGTVVNSTCVAQGDATMLALGFTYDLSKRTALYGTYSGISNNGTRFRAGQLEQGSAGNIATNAYSQLGKDAAGYEFGVRHSF